MPNTTELQFDRAFSRCRDLYIKKMKDYGASWRIMRPSSLTDQIFIKARRIRTIETLGDHCVDEGILPEFIGIVNYGIMALIQLDRGYADSKDIALDEAVTLYDRYMNTTRNLMLAKNHDYGEAWRMMRVSSYTDLILMKLQRTKEIEDHQGSTIVSEGIDANYMDMINYAVFGIIKLTEPDSGTAGC